MSAASNAPPAHPLDAAWPEQDLETVSSCPYCGASEYRLAHEKVQDWSFGAAPGLWNYWACQQPNPLGCGNWQRCPGAD